MPIFCCFTPLAGKSKKVKEEKDDNILQVGLQHFEKPPDKVDPKSKSKSKSTFNVNVKVVSHGSPVKPQVEENEDTAYEAEDEHERDNCSKSKLQFSIDKMPILEQEEDKHTNLIDHHNYCSDAEMCNDGHLSDPGASKKAFLSSRKLKRSCSNLETKRVMLKDKFAPNESFEDLQKLAVDGFMSPVSVTSNYSADRVILRKHSSSQILPSKSRKLWWKLFLWSHRNVHEPIKRVQNKLLVINQQGGYCSDTLEPNRRLEESKSKSKAEKVNKGDRRWDSFRQESDIWPQNQWMAFPAGSPLTRVDEWVQDIPTEPVLTSGHEKDCEITFPPSPENSKPPAGNTNDLPEEIAYANMVIQSLNSSSTVAYISGIGLKVIPVISGFLSLRSVNLSGNSIANITAGSLPKGLHVLNLSRNKISVIEGLRELTRIRILDLSYNRISRIGQGLSNCTLIKELYLAGNKISNVEGLHRLLKLIILDLSFNKITTTKALGQLVANYNSLQALNLLGNPIQSNINDDQIRKTLCGLLPKLAYLNKQPVNPQKAREVVKEAVTKAAHGNGNLSTRRRSVKRVGNGGSSSYSRHQGGQKGSGRHVIKPRNHHRSTKGL
ncbi:putative leucine-rich repeat domain superfamily [Helianthus annuus]|nr:putative leucine-rich repeat domain superfamily [Helianthus annuus]